MSNLKLYQFKPNEVSTAIDVCVSLFNKEDLNLVDRNFFNYIGNVLKSEKNEICRLLLSDSEVNMMIEMLKDMLNHGYHQTSDVISFDVYITGRLNGIGEDPERWRGG